MVGRLVKQQDIRFGCKNARKRGSTRLAAREARRILVARYAELFKQVARAMRIVARRTPRLDEAEHAPVAAQVRLLGEIADRRAGLRETRAAIDFREPGRDLEQGRLARAVAA